MSTSVTRRRPYDRTSPSISMASAHSTASTSTSGPGEVHALLGENGAGKSTILKILRGVQPPTSGAIEIGGVPLTTYSPEASRAAGVAMAFQEMSLVPTLTVAQNVFLTREIKAGGLIDDKAAVAETQEALRGDGGRHRPDAQGRRHPGRPQAADRDHQGDLAALPGAGAGRAHDRPVADRGRPAVRLRASVARERAWRSSTSRTGWTRSSGSPTAPRSCATASTSSPLRCPSSRSTA